MATVFFSYSHKDETFRDELEVHLATLKRQGAIEAWHDRQIKAGDVFGDVIDEHIELADIILLLVSADFLASDYCYKREMGRALERHREGGARVVPVILRSCDWQSTALGELKAVPTDGKPVAKWPDRDDAYLNVVREIRAALEHVAPAPVLRTHTPSSGRSLAFGQAPRSSNLRVRKTFTDADKDQFLDDAYAFVASYFENSLNELEGRNEDITTRFQRIDATRFTATAYRDGQTASQCQIRCGSAFGFGRSIYYSVGSGGIGAGNSFNDSLNVVETEQALALRAVGMSMMSRGQSADRHLTNEGAAELYWSMFIEPLQQ